MLLTLRMLKKHIRNCKKHNRRFDFLGLVENKDLTPDVEGLFKFVSPSGFTGYDWISGNDRLKQLIKEV